MAPPSYPYPWRQSEGGYSEPMDLDFPCRLSYQEPYQEPYQAVQVQGLHNPPPPQCGYPQPAPQARSGSVHDGQRGGYGQQLLQQQQQQQQPASMYADTAAAAAAPGLTYSRFTPSRSVRF